MEYKIDVDEDLGIIKSISKGDWTVDASDTVTKEITELSRTYNIKRVLIDHSELNINVSHIVAYNRPLELKSQFQDIYPNLL